VNKSLSTRTHKCPHCGYLDDRDTNAAINILMVRFVGLKPLLHKQYGG
jgi:putative transposase